MTDADTQWLLDHLDGQAQYIPELTRYVRQHPDESGVLLRVRDEVFTLRETLETLDVPGAALSNDESNSLPAAQHNDRWPSGSDVS